MGLPMRTGLPKLWYLAAKDPERHAAVLFDHCWRPAYRCTGKGLALPRLVKLGTLKTWLLLAEAATVC